MVKIGWTSRRKSSLRGSAEEERAGKIKRTVSDNKERARSRQRRERSRDQRRRGLGECSRC